MRLESACHLLPSFSFATLLPLRTSDHLLIRTFFPSLSLLGSTVHITYAAPAKCTDSLSWAIIEESIKSCFSLSPTFLFFQTGAPVSVGLE